MSFFMLKRVLFNYSNKMRNKNDYDSFFFFFLEGKLTKTKKSYTLVNFKIFQKIIKLKGQNLNSQSFECAEQVKGMNDSLNLDNLNS